MNKYYISALLIAITFGTIGYPTIANAVPVSVPSAPGTGYYLVSTTTGNYIASSTSMINIGAINATSTTATSTFAGGIVGPNNFVVQSNSGRVGIGTSSPLAKLTVTGSNDAGPASSGTTPNGIFGMTTTNGNSLYMGAYTASPFGIWMQAQQNSSLGNSFPLIFNPNGGNVGIGTTSPSHTLELSATAPSLLLGRSGTFSGIAPYVTFQGSNSNFYSMGYRDGTGNFVIGTGQDITSGEQLVIQRTTGNIGIGTTSPSAKLSVTGAGSTTGRTQVWSDSNNVELGGVLDNGRFIFGTSTTALSANLTSTPKFVVLNDTVNAGGQGVNANMAIIDNTTVTSGIGGALLLGGQYRPPSGANDYTYFGAIKALKTNSTAGGGTSLQGQLALYTSVTGTGALTEALRIDQNQRVGISTTSPQAMFTVSATSSLSNVPIVSVAAVPSAGATTTPFTIASTGNVGIATTSPSQGLSLQGTNQVISNGQIAGYTASTTAANTQTLNWNSGNTQRFILDNNTTFIINATSSNPIDGGHYLMKVCQPPAGGKTMSFATPGQLRWIGITPATTTMPTTANSCAFLGLIYDGLYGIYNVASTTGPLF